MSSSPSHFRLSILFVTLTMGSLFLFQQAAADDADAAHCKAIDNCAACAPDAKCDWCDYVLKPSGPVLYGYCAEKTKCTKASNDLLDKITEFKPAVPETPADGCKDTKFPVNPFEVADCTKCTTDHKETHGWCKLKLGDVGACLPKTYKSQCETGSLAELKEECKAAGAGASVHPGIGLFAAVVAIGILSSTK